MKRPEREPERRVSDPRSQAVGQNKWRAQRVDMRGKLNQQDETEQEELLSANPFEWWADFETLEDARFATGPLISVDATGPLMDLFPPMTPPAARPVYPTALPPLPPFPEAQPVYPQSPPTQRSPTQNAYPPAPEDPGAHTSPKPFDGGAIEANRRFSPAPPLQPPSYPPLRERAQPRGPVSEAAPRSAALSSHQAAPLESDNTSYIPAWKVSTARMPAIVARAETVVTIVRSLMKSSGLYAIAALGGPAVSLALTPYLAHNMPVSDYGLLAVLNTSISLFAGLTQLGLGPAFFRAYN